jgi:hypothetical protein
MKQLLPKNSKGLCKRETAQRTYRFNAELWTEFEVDCKLNLRNPRLVVEALVRYWLDVKTSEFIAWHQQKCADGGRMSKHTPIPTARTAAPQSPPLNSTDSDPLDPDDRDFGDVLDV